MVRGPRIRYQDLGAPFSDQHSREYQAPTEYELEKEEEYGPVASRFEGLIDISHPAPSLEELFKDTIHIAQLHHSNRRKRANDWPYPNNTKTLYDVAIHRVMDVFLEVVDLSISSLDIPKRRFKFLFLKKARRPPSLKEFYERIKKSKPVLNEIGYSNVGEMESYETYRLDEVKRFSSELTSTQQEAFDEAVIRAIYAVYRNGIKVPHRVNEEFGFRRYCPPIDGKNHRRSEEQAALRNWVEYLLDETTEPLTFGRSRVGNEIKQYLGSFATSAYTGLGLQSVPDLSDYSYSRKRIPKGSGIGKYINDLPLHESAAKLQSSNVASIRSQFDAVHRKTLSIADNRGFFSQPRRLAIDLYRVDWTGETNEATINRPKKSENDVRSQWTYALLGIIDNEARFTFGVRWLPSKSMYPDAVNDLAPIANDFVEVRRLFADSEMIGGDLIAAIRNIAEQKWAVRVPERGVFKNLAAITPKNHVGYAPSVSWNVPKQTSAIAYPKDYDDASWVEFTRQELKNANLMEEKGQTDLDAISQIANGEKPEINDLMDRFDTSEELAGIGNVKSHQVYMTDLPRSKNMAVNVHSEFFQRWALEESINQVKNDFLPHMKSPNKKLRIYAANVGILFQNWHTLINRSLSPKRGLSLDVTHQELLRVIEDVAFSSVE